MFVETEVRIGDRCVDEQRVKTIPASAVQSADWRNAAGRGRKIEGRDE